MTVLQRLLGSLHAAVFDTSPDSSPVFFVSHVDGVSWSVADEMLVATVNGHSKTYALQPLTVGQLAGQMVIDGFDVRDLSPQFAGLSASVLIEGTGNTLNSNGNRLHGFRDLLHSLMGGYARELRAAKVQLHEALRQMVITQAEGEWLDLWGALYNTPRQQGLSDADYAPLIPEEAFRIRVNAYAIEKAILDLTGQRVHIEEPWGDMFRLDQSRLSSLAKFYDGGTIGYHLIRPVADSAIIWDGIVDIIYRNKAAGVIILPPEERSRQLVNDPLAGIIWFQHFKLWSIWVKTSSVPRLSDNLYLSDYEVEINYRVVITSLRMVSSLIDEIYGRSFMAPVHILGYFSEDPLSGPVLTHHSAFMAGQLVSFYPLERRSWAEAKAPWRTQQTWRHSYSYRIFIRITSISSGIMVDDLLADSTILEARQGADWAYPRIWDEGSWDELAYNPEDTRSWLAPGDWDDDAWED